MKSLFYGCLSTLVLCGLLVYLAFTLYVDGIPAVAHFALKRVPETIDKEIGRELRAEILESNPLDERRTEVLMDFFSHLNVDDKTRVYVVESNEFNAFALPGKYIFVTTETIDKIESSVELTALLLHESAHVENRDGMKSLFSMGSREMVYAIFFNEDSGKGEFMKVANGLLALSNSREAEFDADMRAFRYIVDRKMNPEGLLALYKRMEDMELKNSNRELEYLSTHPNIENRLDRLKDSLKTTRYEPTTFPVLDSLFVELKGKKQSLDNPYWFGW
jgi:Zn-dependent protease with chaperone function